MTNNELQLQQIIQWLNDPWHAFWFMVLTIWALAWKGVALWKAARNHHIIWYIAMLFVNTVGILEIIYIFYFSKKKDEAM